MNDWPKCPLCRVPMVRTAKYVYQCQNDECPLADRFFHPDGSLVPTDADGLTWHPCPCGSAFLTTGNTCPACEASEGEEWKS